MKKNVEYIVYLIYFILVGLPGLGYILNLSDQLALNEISISENNISFIMAILIGAIPVAVIRLVFSKF